MRRPVLARLDVPAQTLLLFEQMVAKDPDRTGNWRYLLREDGCFFSVNNDRLIVADQQSDDPSLFWSSPFSTQPDRCLTAEQLAELSRAITAVSFAQLDDYYASPAFSRTSSPTVTRWTTVKDGVAYTVVVELDAGPPELADLDATVSRLVAAAPYP